MHNATDAAFQRVITTIKQNQMQLLICDDANHLESKHFEILRALSYQTRCTIVLLNLDEKIHRASRPTTSCSTLTRAMKKVKEDSR